MPKVRIPLVGNITARDPASAAPTLRISDQFFQNVMFTQFENGGERTTYVSAQEGLSAHPSAPGAGSNNGSAVKVWTGFGNAIVSAFGSTNSTIYVNTTSLGAITGKAGYISETVNASGTPTLFITSEGNRGYYYENGGALTEITDVDFPPKQTPARTITGNFVHFAGFSGIMCTDGTFWHNDFNAPASWSSSASLAAQDQPDAGVAAIRKGDYIILFGQNTYEPHQNTGNAAGSVLSRVQGAARNVGLINQYSLVPFLDSVAWVGTQNGVGVFIMDGLEPRRISTRPIEMALRASNWGALNFVRLHVLTCWGTPRLWLVVRDLPDAKRGFVYDPFTDRWTVLEITTAVTQADTVQIPGGGGVVSSVVVGNNANGRYSQNSLLGQLDPVVQTKALDFGTQKRKVLKSLRLVGESEVSTQVSVSWSDDDYASFSTARLLTLSTTRVFPITWRCGEFRRRAFKISWADSVSEKLLRLEAIELEYEVLGE